MKKCLFLVLVTVLLASVFGICGCGGTSDNPFLEMLKLIPDTDDTRYSVYISDHARIRELYDVTLPSSDADAEVMEEYIIALVGGIYVPHRLADCSFISGFGPRQYALYSPIRRQNIGFGPLDVDVDISAGVPPLVFEAIKGSFSLSVIEDALSQYDESIMPETSSYQSVVIYNWGPDIHLDTRLMPPAFDQLGRGETIAAQDEYIFRVLDKDNMELMIDTSQGREDSLADNSDFSLMATALSEMGAYSCFMSDQVLCINNEEILGLLAANIQSGTGISEMTVAEIVQLLKEDIVSAAAGQLLSFYRTYATGIGEDDEGPFMTMVFIYDSPEQASSNVDIFRQQIMSGFSWWTDAPWQAVIDISEVWAEGRSLRVKLRGDIVFDWLSIVDARETLLWCGE